VFCTGACSAANSDSLPSHICFASKNDHIFETEMSNMMKDIILNELRQAAEEMGNRVSPSLSLETKVFESGLDSIGFAILVAKLEDRFGFDPFAAMQEAYYPETIGQFISVYENHAASP
jgi:acyl carrier protein